MKYLGKICVVCVFGWCVGVEIGFVLHIFGYFSRVHNGGAIAFGINSGISGYLFEYGFHFIRPFSSFDGTC